MSEGRDGRARVVSDMARVLSPDAAESYERGSATGPALSSPASRRSGSTLICRNVVVCGHRTSLRLERMMWDALAEICQREGASHADICSRVASRRRESSLTAALRVFILSYYRAAATEEGHADAGHGSLAG